MFLSKAKVFSIAMILLSLQNAFAFQQAPVFGEVSKAELQTRIFPADTSASAVILYDGCEVRLEPASVERTSIRRHVRIKILKKSGLEEGTVSVLSGHGGFGKLRGATYNLEEGEIVKTNLDEHAVYKIKAGFEMDEISIAFPAVKVGSVLECSFLTGWRRLYVPTWHFQTHIPVVCSEYLLKTPPMPISYFLKGSLALAYQETRNNDTWRFWQVRDVPAFKTEPLMPNTSVYKSSVAFSPPGSWESIYRELIREPQFMGIIAKCGYLNDYVRKINSGITDEMKILQSISHWMKENVRWNEQEDFYGIDPRDVFKRKSGTSGEINLIFISMLKKAGLDVAPVLLSTRDNGYLLENIPSINEFNYVVGMVTIGNQKLMVDATRKNLPYDLIPLECFNHRGFLIGDGFYSWIPVEPKAVSRTALSAKMTLDREGGMTGTVDVIRQGYDAFDARTKIVATGREAYQKNVNSQGEMKGFAIESLKIEDELGIDTPLSEHYTLTTSGAVQSSGDFVYVDPFVFFQQKVNPFMEEQRLYPVDFNDLKDETAVTSITIPEGYVVDQMPANKIFQLKDDAAKCSFSITQSEREIHVVTRLKINKTLFNTDEYPNLQEFYTRIIAKRGEQIVFQETIGGSQT